MQVFCISLKKKPNTNNRQNHRDPFLPSEFLMIDDRRVDNRDEERITHDLQDDTETPSCLIGKHSRKSRERNHDRRDQKYETFFSNRLDHSFDIMYLFPVSYACESDVGKSLPEKIE